MAELIGTGSDSANIRYRFVARAANSAPQSARRNKRLIA
jgi:hypothetical protein